MPTPEAGFSGVLSACAAEGLFVFDHSMFLFEGTSPASLPQFLDLILFGKAVVVLAKKLSLLANPLGK